MAPRKQTKRSMPMRGKARRRARRTSQSELSGRKASSIGSQLSKTDRVVAMLRHRQGATVAAIGKAMAWKAHTVRGFLSSVVRGRLGLELTSEKQDGVRVYRIVEP